MKAVTHSMSSGFLDKTWSSKYASSLSISTMARSFSTKTINEDVDGFATCNDNSLSEQGYGTFESSSAFSNDVMDMNITSSDIGFETDSGNVSKTVLSNNIPTYDMNLLTPSKKATSLMEKPIESSSLDNLCLEDFDRDIAMLETMSNESSFQGSRRFIELHEETQALLKETFIMNMDLISNNAEIFRTGKSIEFEKETVAQIDGEMAQDQTASFLHASSVEDLGIDMSLSSIEKSSFNADTSLDSVELPVTEPKIDIISTDSEANTTLDSTSSCEPIKKHKACELVKKTVKARGIQRSACRTRGSVNIPRTSNIRKKTKVVKKRAEKVSNVVSGFKTRSPTKHMRSYIVLRQQSRYSDHERHWTSTTQEEQDSASGTDSKSGKKQSKRTVKVLKKRSQITVKTVDDDFEHKIDDNHDLCQFGEADSLIVNRLDSKEDDEMKEGELIYKEPARLASPIPGQVLI